MKFRFKCNKCGGLKLIGEEYYAFGVYYVDITCVKCADSKDIEVSALKALIQRASKSRSNHAEKSNSIE